MYLLYSCLWEFEILPKKNGPTGVGVSEARIWWARLSVEDDAVGLTDMRVLCIGFFERS